ncbi:leucine-rich repeat protein [Mycoplasma phocoeninasale]|uniref:Leucine-rich repeat protein n=1 Tax=Mycoplasma phocoeninasale TaxID=2726117 RepID=A0A858U2U0_9MOLU|nr:leucine-rich repeat domain-containing protein [Mycoplasma phocoeninasale]QJG66359.1 leucine-rich repeat protein [Mycoplasma phocoeninasale]
MSNKNKKIRRIGLGLVAAVITPAVLGLAAIACSRESANDFASQFLLGPKAKDYYNSTTKTLDLSQTNLKSIPQAAFSLKTMLRIFTINREQTRNEIASGIFSDNTINIERIILPESLELIEKAAFAELSSLKEVTFGNNLKEIQDEAFDKTSIENLILPSKISTIGKGAFRSNKIKFVNMKDLSQFTILKSGVFANNLLTEIDLSRVTKIEDGALSQNKFATLTLPTTLTNVDIDFLDYTYPKNQVPPKVKLTILDKTTSDKFKEAISKDPSHLFEIVEN